LSRCSRPRYTPEAINATQYEFFFNHRSNQKSDENRHTPQWVVDFKTFAHFLFNGISDASLLHADMVKYMTGFDPVEKLT
jgi:hypothetical protein